MELTLIWFVFVRSVEFEHVELENKSEIEFGFVRSISDRFCHFDDVELANGFHVDFCFVRSVFDHFGSFSMTWNVVTES